MDKLTDTYTLRGGVQIPCVGFGTWQVPDGETTVRSVVQAVEAGYRHIDTAAIYGNEAGVGEAIRACGVAREELFITTKLWNTDRGYERTLAAFDLSLKKLGLDYLDLFLIHWPANRPRDGMSGEQCNLESWRAMEKLYRDGRVRAIGLSNFLPHHIAPILACAEVAPMVDQIEFHPGVMQPEAVEYCRKHGILVEAWSRSAVGLCSTIRCCARLRKSTANPPRRCACAGACSMGRCPCQSRSQKSGLRKTRRCSISRWMRRIWPQ